MLTDPIKRNVTSLSLSKLTALFEEYTAEHSETADNQDFVAFLYSHKKITLEELKSIRNEEKVDITIADETSDSPKQNVSTVSTVAKNHPNKNDDFSFMEQINEGAMGKILAVREKRLNRIVVYKKIHHHLSKHPTYLNRFLMEAQITAQLQHPNIIPIYALVKNNNNIAYTMKMIDGITMKAYIRETQEQYVKNKVPDEYHTLRARLEHFIKVCDAIHYAHRKGVIHRDLKPTNIMIGTYNEVYVVDWGIAKMFEVKKEIFSDITASVKTGIKDQTTRNQEAIGTPAYMSPEQASGKSRNIDHRSDLYSLGLILFELVTFYRAINGKDADEVLQKARRGQIDKPPAYRKQADEQEQLLAIVKKATQYLPEHRYETVAHFVDDIRRFIRGEAIHARPESGMQKFMRWVSRNRRTSVNIIIGSALLSCLLLVFTTLSTKVQMLQETKGEDLIINNFILKVSNRAYSINSKFLEYEKILEGLTAQATILLKVSNTDEAQYYTDKTIADPKIGAADYKFSDSYGFPVSVDYHVYKLAKNVNEDELKPLLQRLSPLRAPFKSLLMKSYNRRIPASDDYTTRKAITSEGLPIMWAAIVLKEGVMVKYPGQAEFPKVYDPRQQTWYRDAINNTNTAWLNPYVDNISKKELLPVTNPLFGDNGEIIGVASLALKAEFIRNNLLLLYGVVGLENIYLVNEEARVMLSLYSQDQHANNNKNFIQNDYVVSQIKNLRSGYHVHTDNNTEKMFIYNKLNSIGWYYVVVADKEKLINP